MPRGASLIIKHVVRRYINLSDDTKCSLLKCLDFFKSGKGLMYLTPVLKELLIHHLFWLKHPFSQILRASLWPAFVMS